MSVAKYQVFRRAGLLAASLLGAGWMLAGQPQAARADAPVTLHFWAAWDPALPDSKIAQDKIAQFEASHPNIKIDVQDMSFGALHDKLITAIAGGQAPDVSWGLIEWLGELNRMGALADLTEDAAHWPDRSAIYPNVLAGLSVQGHLMALPHYLGIRALLYHQDMLKKAGISSPPDSWAQLVAMAGKIHDANGKYAFAVANDSVRAPQELLMLLAQNDAQIATLHANGQYRNDWDRDPAQMKRATEVFALYKTFLDKGVIAPNSTDWGWEQEDNNFALGQYAMVMDGSWMHLHVAQYPQSMADVRIAPPPGLANRKTFFEINPFYVFKASAHPKEAWEFASFLDSKEYQSAARPTDSPRMDVVGKDMWSTAFTKLASSGIGFPPIALGEVARDMQDAIGRVLLRHEDPAAVAKRFGRAVNHALRQSGELASN